MLYLFHGTDIESSRKKAVTLVNSLRTKRPDAAYEEINSDNWNASLLESHLGGQGLFSSKYIIFLNRITENDAAADEIIDFIPALKDSDNVFIVLEGKLNAEQKKLFAKNAEKSVESEETKEKKFFGGRDGFNIFSLADAFGERRAAKSWAIFREAIERGNEAESILGTLFWQAKVMALSRKADTAAEAGLSPFVFGKARHYAENYSPEEIGELLRKIIVIYHDAHRGLLDAELATEAFLLRIGDKAKTNSATI